MTDLKTHIKRAYRQTAAYQIERLLAEESKWKRRETIARNKLTRVRSKISAVAGHLAEGGCGRVQER